MSARRLSALVWVALALLGLVLPVVPPPAVCQTVFDGLSPNALAPASFCAYGPDAPWRRKLPVNPVARISSENARAQAYITDAGTGRPFWRTVPQDAYANCGGNGAPYNCEGNGGFPIFVAQSTDHPVTFTCHCQTTNYGCWENDANICNGNPTGSYSYPGRAPTNVFGGNNRGTDDVNWAIVQPDGTVFEAYHCQIHKQIADNDVISSTPNEGICVNGDLPDVGSYIGSMLKSNLTSGRGYNGGINSGPNAMAIGLKYAHTVPPTGNPLSVNPNQAIWMNVSCTLDNAYVYPASSATTGCGGGRGLPTGRHLWLNRTHAQIDQAITSTPALAPWRGVLYAAIDYGIYIGDTGCGVGPADGPILGCAWLENATQMVVNGQANPWLPWFNSMQSGSSLVYTNPFLSFASNVEVVADCYALPQAQSIAAGCTDATPPASSDDCSGGQVIPPPAADTGPLIAYWTFNENTGMTVADTTDATQNTVAQNLAFSATNPPGWTPSVAGQGSALNCPLNTAGASAATALTVTTAYSWAGWVWASTTPGSLGQEVFGGAPGLFGFSWGHNTPGTFAQAAYHHMANDVYMPAKIQTPLQANTWYWVGAVWTGSELRVFLNGARSATTSNVTSLASNSGPPVVCPFWQTGSGKVDELKIWNTALTDLQMQAEYTSYTVQQQVRHIRHRRGPVP
jgi:hypothetical protein